MGNYYLERKNWECTEELKVWNTYAALDRNGISLEGGIRYSSGMDHGWF